MKSSAKNGIRLDIKMIDLNNLGEIKKLDPKNVYESTEMLADQCKQIWNDSKSLELSDELKTAKNIIICGMGGSAYGGHVALSLFKDALKIPLFVNNDYTLPAFADEDSLVILTSYSGSTEETLSCLAEAIKKGCKIIGLTSGGKLAESLKNSNKDVFIFQSKFNPSNQPRLGTGYIVLGTIAILNRLGFLSIPEKDAQTAIENLKKNKETIKEKAKEISNELQNFIPVIFAAEFLEGNSHIIRNQFNETSKSFSSFHVLPELNHHLMEGLKNPKENKLKIIFINSDLYSDKTKKRITLTKDVISKNGVPYLEFETMGDTRISQSLSALSFGGYLTLYLSLLYGLDPSLIPWVDYFKDKLKS